MAGKLDARAKLVAALFAVVAVSSTPPGSWFAFGAYALCIIVLWVLSGAHFRAIAGRVTAGAPFVILAGLLMWVASGWVLALTILLKGLMALTILSILIVTTEVSSLIWAIRKIGAPRAVNMIAAMMLRYVAMLTEEFGRMSRARASRAGSPLAGVALFQVHGNQTGLLLVRSWERAERIHNAMLSRGFTGTMPEIRKGHFGGREIIFTAAVIASFSLARLFLR